MSDPKRLVDAARLAWAFAHEAQQRVTVDDDFRARAAVAFEALDLALAVPAPVPAPPPGGATEADPHYACQRAVDNARDRAVLAETALREIATSDADAAGLRAIANALLASTPYPTTAQIEAMRRFMRAPAPGEDASPEGARSCDGCRHHGRCEREKIRATVPGWRQNASDCDAYAAPDLRAKIIAHLDAAGLTQARLIVEGLWPRALSPEAGTGGES